ncbi:MAG TPA: twin-arginine translocation signal domain-containing protein, partial [Acidobacteriaceae bacterium]|nr:twin-arginine translocation signal domain-containing protein [Acidobacteriaceae bacterium]
MKKRINRRQFVQASAGAAAAASLLPSLNVVGQSRANGAGASQDETAWPENGALIPDTGWRLWVDREAQWKQDVIYLPDEVTQHADGVVRGKGEPLPVNPPTGGWAVLAAGGKAEHEGMGVVLPSTVEQHYWGKFGERPYTPQEYRYAATNPPTPSSDDSVPQNGAYFGVSWWWREIDIPASMQGKRIFLHVRGAHLRAEVYLNEKLVGYSIMEELPFEAELTHAARPGGRNVLAIRITNPFGRFDWVDGLNEQWGAVKIYRSHGFGGLDRGMTISAHNGARIKNVWVLNTPEPRRATAYIQLDSLGPISGGQLALEIVDRATGKVLFTQNGTFYNIDDRGIATDPAIRAEYEREQSHPSPTVTTQTTDFSFQAAQLWDLESPKLYDLRIRFTSGDVSDIRTIAFGFRSFGVDGLGTSALFRLNGRRMKIYTAISWGYWGINGMWPTPELAVKEVTQAKKLNLTCLNFHRNLAKEEVLRAHDRLGLLRYMEPGAGKMAIGMLPAGVTGSANSVVME